MLEDLNQGLFEPLVRSSFAVSDVDGSGVAMELVEVAGGSKDPRFEHFALLFRGPTEPLLPQKIYTLTHPKIGTFQLFLVPVGRHARGTSYEAVFNRFKEGCRTEAR